MAKENQEELGEWTRAWGSLPEGDPEERARVAEVRLAEALAVLDVLKAPGSGSLENKEKHRAGERARAAVPKARVGDVLEGFRIAKSTYFSQGTIGRKPDKYAALRTRVRAVFEESGAATARRASGRSSARGRAPVRPAELADGDLEMPVAVSEKVVRRLMHAENLVPVQVG